MPKIMKMIVFISFVSGAAAAALFSHFNKGAYLTLAITFGTVFYHFGIRLLIGTFYNIVMKNRADYMKRWYQLRPWENRLYQFLHVKKWKNCMPTYAPDVFSPQKHTWDEIAQAMCQSELVHETNVVFSFLPVTASVWFGAFPVFLITSVCGALFDLLFVAMQRYNRARIMKIIDCFRTF